MHRLNLKVQLLDKIFLLDYIVSVVDLRHGYEHKEVGVDHVHAHLSQVANKGERFLSLLVNIYPDKFDLVLSALNLIENLEQV